MIVILIVFKLQIVHFMYVKIVLSSYRCDKMNLEKRSDCP